MLNLTISHIIYLTKKERYTLYNGVSIETVGLSVPIWCKDGNTSEPGKEIFCKYVICNPRTECPIKILKDGYEITLPYRLGKKEKLSDEKWLDLSMNNPDALHQYYSQAVSEVSSKNLLDPEHGGGRCLVYREHNKITIGKEPSNVVHYVKIDDMDELLESIY